MKWIVLLFLIPLLLACDKEDTRRYYENTEDMVGPFDPSILTSDVVVINDVIGNKKIVIAGNEKDQYIVSFERELDGKLLEFSSPSDPLPVILEDEEGNKWDIFGYAIDGPGMGQRLKPTQSIMGFWFSFATFYPGIQIYPDLDGGEFNGNSIVGADGWLVPMDEVRLGGVGKDGIPAISNPKFEITEESDFLDNVDLVVGISDGITEKAYPHHVLDWHEIVNDDISDVQYSIIYCPLTWTATAWDRNLNGELTTFGVSGLHYNTNIVPYDRSTESNWSQLFDVSFYGDLLGTRPVKYMVLETKWETWKKIYPDSKVMNYKTGFARSYGLYPYGDYREEEYLLFPVKYHDTRLHEKERVHCVVTNGKARVYRFKNFRPF